MSQNSVWKIPALLHLSAWKIWQHVMKIFTRRRQFWPEVKAITFCRNSHLELILCTKPTLKKKKRKKYRGKRGVHPCEKRLKSWVPGVAYRHHTHGPLSQHLAFLPTASASYPLLQEQRGKQNLLTIKEHLSCMEPTAARQLQLCCWGSQLFSAKVLIIRSIACTCTRALEAILRAVQGTTATLGLVTLAWQGFCAQRTPAPLNPRINPAHYSCKLEKLESKWSAVHSATCILLDHLSSCSVG